MVFIERAELEKKRERMNKTKIILIGATRGTGREIAMLLLHSDLAKNYSVTILCRNAQRLDYDISAATVITGDALSLRDLTTAINGASIVVSTLGVAPSFSG